MTRTVEARLLSVGMRVVTHEASWLGPEYVEEVAEVRVPADGKCIRVWFGDGPGGLTFATPHAVYAPGQKVKVVT